MALVTPYFLEPKTGSSTYQAADFRNVFSELIPVAGVFATNDLQVTQNGAGDASVNVASGGCAVLGNSAAGLGTYVCRSTATVNVALAGGFPASGTRTDAVVAQVYDDQTDSSGLMSWTPIWVTNTSVGTGTVPTLPNNSLLLASVAVISGHSAIFSGNITDARTWATGISGRDRQEGGFTITFSGASTTSGTVNFPRSFAGVPIVTLSCNAITDNTAVVINLKTGATKSSFNWFAYVANGSTYTGSVSGAYRASY